MTANDNPARMQWGGLIIKSAKDNIVTARAKKKKQRKHLTHVAIIMMITVRVT
jgi:hypothetical protein